MRRAYLLTSSRTRICDYWLVLLSATLNFTLSATFMIVMDIYVNVIYLV